MNAGIAHANRLKEKADAAFSSYMRACESYDWVKANDLHIQAVTHMELFLDEIGGLYKRLEVAQRGR